jgi:hypothetical protein
MHVTFSMLRTIVYDSRLNHFSEALAARVHIRFALQSRPAVFDLFGATVLCCVLVNENQRHLTIGFA